MSQSIGPPVRRSAPLAYVLACLALTALRPAWANDDFFDDDAQTPSPITDFFSLRASYWYAWVNTELRVDPSGLPLAGTPLNGTQDLGYKPDENEGTIEVMFRLRERNRIRADFTELDQAGAASLSRPTVFGNQEFNTGTVLNSSLVWRVLGITYTYAFIQNDHFELGVGAGVHLMDLSVRGNAPATFQSYDTSVAGAVPTPALEAIWRATNLISFTARGDYIKANLNETTGSFGDFHTDVQFRVFTDLQFGAGYSLMKLKVDSTTYGNPGLSGIRLRGPELFVRASF